MIRPTLLKVIVFACVTSSTLLGRAQSDKSQPLEFFETRIRPLLSQRCYKCHSAKAKKLQGGLLLDSRAELLKGGDSGAAIQPGKPDESLLIESVRYQSLEMPPKGKLSEAQIAHLAKWVEMGAPWPDESAPRQTEQAMYDWNHLREQHWAWRPPRKPTAPEVDDGAWVRSPIDRFVLAKLESKQLRPSPPADKRVLIRRAFFDLLGLPPSPQETEAFLQDDRNDAFAQLIDRLLDSPHYGERWGRHWLDVARYSDGLGGFLDNAELPHAYRYRDWVIQAINEDLPYDEFVRRQIAGDLMNDEEAIAATGFFALGPTYISDGGDPESKAQAKSETLDDRVDTLSRGLLGLTVSCARCHDHKFDPIPTQDYYSFAGIFNNTKTVVRPIASQEYIDRYNAEQQNIKQLERKINQRNGEVRKDGRQPTQQEEDQLTSWRQQLEELRKNAAPRYAEAHSLADIGQADMPVALRGDLRKPGPIAPRRLLQILAGEDSTRFSQGSGRLELAEAIASADNPLTARVIVNRVWLHHFGEALVRSPSNFGFTGEPPTHPGLLDWLAVHFVESGWSLKSLHRTIMLSSTYRMGSRREEQAFAVDGDNRLLWRMNPRRLDVEAWRDALLCVTGELDPSLGGPPTDKLLQSKRRTVYTKISRNGDRFESDEFLRLFDFPTARATGAKRVISIVPQQYLFMMNGRFMLDRAQALATRIASESEDEPARIHGAYQLLFGRPPSPQEAQLGEAFLAGGAGDGAGAAERWRLYAQVLLSSNEFMYLR